MLADAVVPVAYAIDGEQHYADLVAYKSARPASLAIGRLSTIVELFVREHLSCVKRLTGDGPLHVGVVPSTRGRSGLHPVTALLKLSPHTPLITILSTGWHSPDYREFATDRFTVDRPPSGWAGGVLLIDDTWVTGARIQSAAYAIKSAGAPAVVAVALGRRIKATWEPARPLLERARSVRYDPGVCALCESPRA